MAGVLRVPLLYRERHFGIVQPPSDPSGTFLVGKAVAAGVGPLERTGAGHCPGHGGSDAHGGVGRGAARVVPRSASAPFVALGSGASDGTGMAWLRRCGRGIELADAAAMAGVGVLFVTGARQSCFRPLHHEFARPGWPPI